MNQRDGEDDPATEATSVEAQPLDVPAAPEVAGAVQAEPYEPDASAQSGLLHELRDRLIHIELKTDGVLGRLAELGVTSHPDQAFGGRSFAQFGEDLVILNIFYMLGMVKPSYLDVGAHHPFTISNTALLYARGSRGINVEANPNLMEAFHQHRSEDINLNVGVGPKRGTLDFHFIDDWSGRNTFRRDIAEEFIRKNPDFRIRKIQPIPLITLSDIVTEHAGGRFPDLLTLDVEGMDLDILEATSFGEHPPTVICVEAEASDRPAETAAMIALLMGRGYVPFTRTVANLLFVRQAAAGKIGMHAVMSTVR